MRISPTWRDQATTLQHGGVADDQTVDERRRVGAAGQVTDPTTVAGWVTSSWKNERSPSGSATKNAHERTGVVGIDPAHLDAGALADDPLGPR